MFNRERVQIFFDDDPGLTHQEFQASCDIHTIIKSFRRQGIDLDMPSFSDDVLDFSNDMNYQDILNSVIDANNKFYDLPANVRKRFRDDPREFVAFFDDPANAAEAVKLGLATVREQDNLKKPESIDEGAPSST